MRIVTFESERGTSVGALVPDGVVDLAELLPAGTPQAMLEALIDGFEDVRGAIDALPARPVTEVRLRASVPDPGKVLCVMRNRPGLEEGDAPPYAYLKYAGGGVGAAMRSGCRRSRRCGSPRRSPSSSAARCATSPRRTGATRSSASRASSTSCAPVRVPRRG